MKFRPLFLLISSILIGLSLYSIFTWGFQLSIDFAGGTVWEIRTSLNKDEIIDILKQNNISPNSISQAYVLKFGHIDNATHQQLIADFKKLDKDFTELRFETLGPVLGKELLRKTIYAIILSSTALLIFIASRFNDWTFGLGAILANFHDTFILLGAFSWLGHFYGSELDSLFVTALLTTLSASVHDTVVTFNRIRELKRQNLKIDWLALTDQALRETIVRSLNNSMTIVFMLTALVILGGETTRWFATALLIGCVSGTYSSFGVALPLILFFKRFQKHGSLV